MAQHILIIKIEDAFYREFSEQGTTEEALREQLSLDIQDQLDEYDLHQLLTRLVSAEYQENMLMFAPKKDAEEPSEYVLIAQTA